MRINISIEDTLLAETDLYCKKEARTRSNVIALALKDYLRKKDNNEPKRN